MIKESKTYIAFPPGETIREVLDDRKMTQKEFSCRMDMSQKHISHLINGEVQLTNDMALRLEMVLGIEASFWNNLERQYREKLVKVEMENQMDEDIGIIEKIPYRVMEENGWIEKGTDIKETVMILRKYFEVVNLSLIDKPAINRIVCKNDNETGNDYNLISWAQRAKLLARNITVSKVNTEKLQLSLERIRAAVKLSDNIMYDILGDILSECGIALVLLPYIGGSYPHGATFYDGGKIVLALTENKDNMDKMMLDLFHEIAHILLGHINSPETTDSEDENAADLFAKQQLIELNRH